MSTNVLRRGQQGVVIDLDIAGRKAESQLTTAAQS
jgi:hypothetical protein